MPIRCGVRTAGGLAVVIFVVLPATSAEPPAGRGGGLVPGTSAPPVRATREELLRDWDLDGDGSISKSEADVARARMKRKRLEIQLGAGIDPVTGLPRGSDSGAEASDPEAGDEPVFRLPPEPPSEPGRATSESPPGMRAPRSQPPVAAPQRPRSPASPAPASQPAATAPAPRSARASWLPPQRLAPAVTGGVRAGAPAATSGYGAGAWGDLNAGRRPTPLAPDDAGAASGSTAASGGLLPSVRQPGRTGSMILPALPGRPTGAGVPGLPPPPAAGGITRPRVTAEEIGAERQ
ncbi:MAG: hypothetical protein ACKO1M_09900 [Planctomycetota bacterium]